MTSKVLLSLKKGFILRKTYGLIFKKSIILLYPNFKPHQGNLLL